jgi:hypothetical protein
MMLIGQSDSEIIWSDLGNNVQKGNAVSKDDDWNILWDEKPEEPTYTTREKVETAAIITIATSIFLGAWYWSLSIGSPWPICMFFAITILLAVAEGTETSLDGRG